MPKQNIRAWWNPPGNGWLMRETKVFRRKAVLTWRTTHRTNYALAALRYNGFRSENRYLVFQVLEHTVGMAPAKWRVLAKTIEISLSTQIKLRLNPLSELIHLVTELEAREPN